MARYDRNFDYGLRGRDQVAPERRGSLLGAAGRDAGYDRDFAPRRPDARGYDYGFRGAPPARTRRVTAQYNLDYVFPDPDERPVNYNAYGGSPEIPVGDLTRYQGQYVTQGGTRTGRGSRPVFWERAYSRYGRDFG